MCLEEWLDNETNVALLNLQFHLALGIEVERVSLESGGPPHALDVVLTSSTVVLAHLQPETNRMTKRERRRENSKAEHEAET